MTEANRKANIAFEWRRATESLQAVDALVASGLWADAVSRAYYGMFHIAHALLLSRGLQAKSHGGVVHLLSVHFVQTQVLPAELVRLYSQMQRLREDADYETALIFDEASALEARQNLERFRQAVETILRDLAYL